MADCIKRRFPLCGNWAEGPEREESGRRRMRQEKEADSGQQTGQARQIGPEGGCWQECCRRRRRTDHLRKKTAPPGRRTAGQSRIKLSKMLRAVRKKNI